MIDASLIDNAFGTISGPYAAIIGANPSKGARSPKLWNAAFTANRNPSVMVPLDVTSAGLAPLLAALDADPYFVGGAIAVPHKQATAHWLRDRVTQEAAAIGAVNCLFRRDDRLWGTNTDGEAARVCLERAAGSLQSKHVVLLGLGGAGKAVAAFLAKRAEQLSLAGRNFDSVQAYATAVGSRAVRWDSLRSVLPDADVAVNCTSVGSAAAGMADGSPLSDELVRLLHPAALVYDIIYDPRPTRLLAAAAARGLLGLDGAGMNFEQAVLAYIYAVGGDQGAVRAAMEKAAA